MEVQPGRTLGEAKCPACRAPGTMKVNKKAHLYFNCKTPADGGCMTQCMSRHKAGDTALARYVVKWDRAEERAEYLGAEAPPPKPAAVPKAKPKAAPAPAPKAAPVAPPSSGFAVNPMDRFR